MLSTQVVPVGQSGLSRWLVPGGIQIGRPTYMSYYQQQLPQPVTSKRPPRRCCCHPCVALVVFMVLLLLLLVIALPLVFLIPRGPEFTEDIVVEVSSLEYPYIENLLQRDDRLFFAYESGFCRNLRTVITAVSYRVGADYGDCQLQAISRYIEDSQPMNIGTIFTLKLTLESSLRISPFVVDRALDAIIEGVTAGEVGGRPLVYFEGTRVLSFPGRRDPVFPATVEVFLFLSIGVPGLLYDSDFQENNPEEFDQLQTSFCGHLGAAVASTSSQVSLRDCFISDITRLDVARRRRKRQTGGGSMVMLTSTVNSPAATAGPVTEQVQGAAADALTNILVNGFLTSTATADASLTTTLPPPTTSPPPPTTPPATPFTPPFRTTARFTGFTGPFTTGFPRFTTPSFSGFTSPFQTTTRFTGSTSPVQTTTRFTGSTSPVQTTTRFTGSTSPVQTTTRFTGSTSPVQTTTRFTGSTLPVQTTTRFTGSTSPFQTTTPFTGSTSPVQTTPPFNNTIN